MKDKKIEILNALECITSERKERGERVEVPTSVDVIKAFHGIPPEMYELIEAGKVKTGELFILNRQLNKVRTGMRFFELVNN